MAWNLKRFADTLNFFGALPIANLFQTSPRVAITMTTDAIFDFTIPNPNYASVWGCLDDVVMGGVSQSNFQLQANSALFMGLVSTDNSGGFVSVRTRNFEPAIDLSKAVSINIKVKGDGNRYKFFLRDSTGWDSIAYSYSFDTIGGKWIAVIMPFSEFVPVFRAKTVSNAPPLALKSICSIQLMLSKFEMDGKLNPAFQSGSFSLEIASIVTA